MLSDLKNIVISYLDLEVILTYCQDQKLIARLLAGYNLPTVTEAITTNSLKSVQYLLSKDDCLDIADYELARSYPLIFNYLSEQYLVNMPAGNY